MAFDETPTTWIPDWSEDGTTISIPLATFAELTAAEADATTGDIRKILYALCEKFYDSWNNTVTADRPTRMTIYKSSSPNVSTGITTHTYQFRFENAVSAQDVADEPA